MKKITLLEILVVVAILTTSFAVGYKFLKSNNNTEFSGDEMYKCAWIADKIIKKGFPLYAEIEGRWTSSNEEFKDKVLITKANGGTLFAIYKNQTITIGGKLASKEDIAANKIKLMPLGNTIIKYELAPINAHSFKDIKTKIDIPEHLTVLDVYVYGTFGIDSKTYSPSEQQKIKNYIQYSIPNANLYFTFGGVIFNGKVNLDYLDDLDNLLKPENITTSNLDVYIIVNETISQINMSKLKFNDVRLITWS
ncbi:TrmB family transcriptional regulator sugar-binding domain-containing protein [Methanotorris igneus]|uniref:Transcription regulator TrmB C-terminal domain-containing protein n=1 Tax=Methanotorris igneus (strain DSM 5666 / JCM 11834 / Kol 5) TaxID=880724 RepID=F6BAV2_METIK|nr:TrmB family transcriptional regulator sugar-binding domain-containing protein [Methanotorris igneus]AEF97039.1 hypothetical protein Metig_1505 [Methanotorris igneus Kol 5]